MGESGDRRRPGVMGGPQPAEDRTDVMGGPEQAEEDWIDKNSIPLIVNRYNGTLIRGE